MQKLLLVRQTNSDEGVFGEVEIAGRKFYSLELPWKSNLRQKSCILAGSYRCKKVRSPKFGWVYGVAGVPGRSHILLHAANFAGDKEKNWDSQLLGCIALGEALGSMRNTAGKMQKALLRSRSAMTALEIWASGKEFELEIIWK